MKARHFLKNIPSPTPLSQYFIRIALGGLLLASGTSFAGILNWDSDANAGNGANGGTGTWNTTTTNWFNGASDVAWPNVATNYDQAILGGTAGTVTLGASLTAGKLQFDTSNYTLSGTSDLTLNINATGDDAFVVSNGVSNVTIGVRRLILTASGSGAIGDLINTDKVNFGSTIVAFSGSRQMTLTNSAASATTTFTNFAVGSGSPGGASLYLNQGNLTITNLAASTNGSNALSATTVTSAPGLAFRYSGSDSTKVGTITLTGNNTLLNTSGAGGTLAINFLNPYATYDIQHNNALGARNASNNLTTTFVEFNGGTLISSNGARTLENAITHTGTFAIGGSNAITLSGAYTQSGGNRILNINNPALTTLSGPVYLANDNTTARTLTIGGTGNALISGAISNNNVGNTLTSSLIKSGSGTTLTLGNAANTYTGVTTVGDGVLSVATLANGGSSSSIGASSGAATNLVIGSAGTFQYTGSTVATDRGFDTTAGAGKIEVTNANTTLTFSGNADSVTKTGSGTLVLSGSNSYSGLTVSGGTLRIANPTSQSISGTLTANTGGTLQLGGSNSDQLHDNTTLAIDSGGFLDMAGMSEKVKNISGAGTVINSGGSQSTLTVSGFSGNTVFDGTITGNTALTHSDPNCSTTLNGLNTYSGSTSINSSTATFNIGSTGGLSFYIGANGVNNWINGAAGATVNLDGTFTFDLTNAATANGNLWNIVETGDLLETFGTTFSVAGFTQASDVWTKADGNNTWTFEESTGALSLAVIPEPGTIFLGALGMLALLRRRNR